MAELDEPVEGQEEALSRLEAALDRIERHARPVPVTDAAVIAARLDTLIDQLRNALAEATG
jgi:predicted trehalose synthase